jgi:nucleotide-binding universal stress UspA family protein
MPMFQLYTEQARRAVFYACAEAVLRGASAISTAHVLLGLSWDEYSRAGTIIPLKDGIIDLCALLNLPHRPCTATPYPTKLKLSLDADSKKTLAYAAEEAERDGWRDLDTDHLLRGLLRFDNEGSKALNAISIDLPTVRAASERHRAEFPPERPSFMKTAAFWIAPIKGALVKLAIIALVALITALVVRWLNY